MTKGKSGFDPRSKKHPVNQKMITGPCSRSVVRTTIYAISSLKCVDKWRTKTTASAVHIYRGCRVSFEMKLWHSILEFMLETFWWFRGQAPSQLKHHGIDSGHGLQLKIIQCPGHPSTTARPDVLAMVKPIVEPSPKQPSESSTQGTKSSAECKCNKLNSEELMRKERWPWRQAITHSVPP